jgi:CrcB protein
MIPFLWVSLGGALGSGTRFLVGQWAVARFGPGFPYGTLIVNLSGAFLLSFVMRLAMSTGAVPVHLRLFLTTGLLGGFTTYSSLNYESLRLMDDGNWMLSVLNISVTVIGCLLTGIAGLKLADLLG